MVVTIIIIAASSLTRAGFWYPKRPQHSLTEFARVIRSTHPIGVAKTKAGRIALANGQGQEGGIIGHDLDAKCCLEGGDKATTKFHSVVSPPAEKVLSSPVGRNVGVAVQNQWSVVVESSICSGRGRGIVVFEAVIRMARRQLTVRVPPTPAPVELLHFVWKMVRAGIDVPMANNGSVVLFLQC